MGGGTKSQPNALRLVEAHTISSTGEVPHFSSIMPIDLALVLRDPAKLAELRASQRKRSADDAILDRAIALYGRLRTDRHALDRQVRPGMSIILYPL